MQRLPHLKAGIVVSSDTIDEFLDYGVYSDKNGTEIFRTQKPFTFTKEQIISTATVQNELSLIKEAFEHGPDSKADIRHRVIWRNAALALATCDEPPHGELGDAFDQKLSSLRQSHANIQKHTANIMESWGK